MFVIILYQSIAIKYKSTYSDNYNKNQYSYMSDYVISILYLQTEPIIS